ncbi:MAG: hemerythrin domain-containing protein [Thermodesulfobacteriota bacterium]
MENYLNRSIKEVIKEYPQIERILANYGIECGSCTMGLCLVKDVLEIHKLPPPDSAMLKDRLRCVFFQEAENINSEKRGAPLPHQGIIYTAPIKKLVAEHLWIKRWLTLIPDLIAYLSLNPEEKRNLIIKGVDFIRSYADKFHHAKEEDILFKYFPEDLDILRVMKEEHKMARSLVQNILTNLEQGNDLELIENLLSYQELLQQHIKKEDEVLFPWLEKQLAPEQINELGSKFQNIELEMNFDPRHYEKFIEEWAEKTKINHK